MKFNWHIPAFILIVLLVIFTPYYSKNKTNDQSETITPAETPIDIEKYPDRYILSKLTKDQVSDKFVPVFLYKYVYGQQGFFMGVGTLFTGSNGEEIITAEHLITKVKAAPYQGIVYRKLRPLEDNISHQVEKVLKTGADFARTANERPDVMTLKPGPFTPIDFNYDQPLTWEVKFNRVPVEGEMTSLVTGQKVPILGAVSGTHGYVLSYYILEYDAIEGESGTGFVDDRGNLYILSSIFEDFGDVGYLKDESGANKKLILVYGPINLGIVTK